jgi:glucose/arabinose dehydrogenase/chitodextrinase
MTGLNWPIALAFSPDGRIFFAERLTGNIRIIESGILLATPFYTLSNTATSGERGLLGLALDPGFPSTPYVYAYQTYNDVANGTIYNRIVRILANGNAGVSHSVILRMPPLSTATNHNGGVIAFGPDGKLYAVVGENANPPLSQDPLSPMGKVLRMNPDGSAPTDNPFYGLGGWNPLVYTYGHRNMFGLAFRPTTGRAYVTENGPGCNDEVNVLTAGRNYGWGPTQTCATPPSPPGNTNQDGPSPVLPIWWWAGTICPTNAAIYAGPAFPAWQGDLFMGDCNFSHLHRLHLVPPGYDSVESDTILWTAPSAILDVETGPDGAIWVTTPSAIYRYWDSALAPSASFAATPNPTYVGVAVAFDASASTDPDGTIVAYDWDFGDSSAGSGVTTSHAYASPGTFSVTLTVRDNESLTANAYRDVVVQVPPGHAAPVAQFVASPSPTDPGVPVTFNGSSSYDPDGTIVSYTWDFGDSEAGSGVTTTHSYAAPGAYSATLTVVDNESLSATTSHEVIVAARETPLLGIMAPFLVLAVVVVAAVLLAWWVRRRREPRAPPPSTQP